jgi:hypothetical protein
MLKTRMMKVGQAEAVRLLERNTMNRHVRDSRVKQYASDMRSGLWRQTGDTIKITAKGDLLDGQHRLWAVIESGVPTEFLIVEGLDEEVMPAIDTGATRNLADVTRIAGYDNTATLATALRWLFWIDDSERTEELRSSMKGKHNKKPTSGALADYLNRNPDLTDRVAEIVEYKKALKLLGAGLATAVYVLAHRESPGKAVKFFQHLDSGVNLSTDSPVYQLRERMQMSPPRAATTERFCLALKAFRLFADNKPSQALRWQKSEGIPVVGGIEVFKPRKAKK